MRDQNQFVTSVTVPSGAGPGTPRTVLAGPGFAAIPPEVIAFYAPSTVLGGLISYDATGRYEYRVSIVSPGGIVSVATGFWNLTVIKPTILEHLAGALSEIVIDADQLAVNSAGAAFAGLLTSSGGLLVNAGQLDLLAGVGFAYAGESIVTTGSWSPVWTQSVTNPTLNDGTVSGRYRRQGDLCWVSLALVIGAGTVLGTGTFRFSLPFPPAADQTLAGAISDASVATNRFPTAAILSAANGRVEAVWPTAPAAPANQTTPIPWAAGDRLFIDGTYSCQP